MTLSALALAALAALPACSGGGGGGGSIGSTASPTTSGQGGGGIGPGPGSPSADFDAPSVAITAPARGSYFSGSAVVRVEGTANDGQGSGIAAFSINNVPTPLDAQRRFSVDLTLDEGVTIIVARAADFAGNVGQASVSVIFCPDYRNATDDIPGAVGARISEAAVNAAAPAMVQSILASGAITQSLTGSPLYRGDVRDPFFGACIASAEVRVLSMTFGTPTILFDAVPGGFDADVRIPSFRIDANARSYCGIGYSVTGNVSATEVQVRLGLDVSIQNGQFVVATRSGSVAMNGFQWGIHNIPAAITNIAHSTVKREIEKRLSDVVQNQVPSELQQALQGIARPISRSFNGKTVTFRAVPEALGFDGLGFQVDFSSNVTAARDPRVPLVPGSFFRSAPAGAIPVFQPGPGFVATANENLMNRALFTSWQAGFWTIQLDTQFFQQFGLSLPVQLDANLIAAFFPPLRGMVTPGSQIPVAIRLDPKIQPLVEMTGTPDLARLSLGEMHMTVLMDFGAGYQPLLTMAVHVRAGANATFQGSAVRFAITQNVEFQADEISAAIPLSGIDVERFLTFLVPPAVQVATQSMAPIPIPSIGGGVQLTNLNLYRDGARGEFLSVSGDVR
jgi:hypothetical protein